MAGQPVLLPETIADARARADRAQQALDYLDCCGDMTFQTYKEAWRRSGVTMSEWELKGLWENSITAIIATKDLDFPRTHLRQELRKAVALFGTIAASDTAPPPVAEPARPVPRPAPQAPPPEPAPPAATGVIRFPCPQCQRRVTAPAQAAGRRGTCPYCGHKSPIPTTSTLPARPASGASPAAGRPAASGPTTSGPAADRPLTEGPSEDLGQALISANDPIQRLRLGVGYRDRVLQSGNKEAADAVLVTMTCDDRGEVAVGLALALARPKGPYAKALRGLMRERFITTGDSTFFGGKPLLRLAYVAALEGDLARLREMVAERPDDNGVDLIGGLIAALERGEDFGVHRVMAWGEALDQAFQPAILEILPDTIPGKAGLISGLAEAAGYVSRQGGYR